jgi:hypothetical protein
MGALSEHGLSVVPAAEKFLHDAVASGDKGKILRAFHDAIYSRAWKMSEAIPAIKEYLNDTNPFVRYNAAQALFTAGDQSGYSTLLALVQAADPIDGIEQDVRIQAARTLAQFRQIDAAQAIYDLYQQTKNGYLIEPLVTLGSPNGALITEAKGFFPEASSLIFYGQAGAQQFLPQITTVFQQTANPDLKVAAAWALFGANCPTWNHKSTGCFYYKRCSKISWYDPNSPSKTNLGGRS